MPFKYDVDDKFLLGAAEDPREVAEKIGLDWWAAKKLYDDKWLSFDPETSMLDTNSKSAEFTFLGSLVAAGCDQHMLKKLLATLEKPYRYALYSMYYDWEERYWKDYDTPYEAVKKRVTYLEDDDDIESLKELLEDVNSLVQKAINRLSKVNDTEPCGKENSGSDEFQLTEDDYHAIEIAKNVAHRFLKHPGITPEQVIGIRNALYALERLPAVTSGANSELGLEYRAGDNDFSEMKYINFSISESAFEISQGGSVYDSSVGGDNFSGSGWIVEVGDYRNAECDLDDLENMVMEYLNLGAKFTVSDESEIECKDDITTEIMPSNVKQTLIQSLNEKHDEIVGSYQYSLRDLIAVLEDTKYDSRHMIRKNSRGYIIEYELFFVSSSESWQMRCGREGIYTVDPIALQATKFDLQVMN